MAALSLRILIASLAAPVVAGCAFMNGSFRGSYIEFNSMWVDVNIDLLFDGPYATGGRMTMVNSERRVSNFTCSPIGGADPTNPDAEFSFTATLLPSSTDPHLPATARLLEGLYDANEDGGKVLGRLPALGGWTDSFQACRQGCALAPGAR